MLLPNNTRHQPPLPNSILVNEGQGARINFVKGKTYRFRIISFAAFASAMVHFDSHDMNVIMNDGAYIKKKMSYQLRVSASQRYDVLISCIDRDNKNFPFLISLDRNRDWTNKASTPPISWPQNFTGQLVMDPNWPLGTDVVNEWRPDDDAHFEPYGVAPILPAPNKVLQFDFQFCFDKNNLPR
jgi:iron transport multicopper oxidase